MSIAKAEALRSAEKKRRKIFSMAGSGHFLSLYIRSERRESALSTMSDLKGEKPKCHIHPGGSARPAGYGWHFAHAVIQTKGNSNEDSAAGRVPVLRGADARRGRHRRVAETRLSTSVRTIHLHLAEKSTTKSSRWLDEGILSVFIY